MWRRRASPVLEYLEQPLTRVEYHRFARAGGSDPRHRRFLLKSRSAECSHQNSCRELVLCPALLASGSGAANDRFEIGLSENQSMSGQGNFDARRWADCRTRIHFLSNEFIFITVALARSSLRKCHCFTTQGTSNLREQVLGIRGQIPVSPSISKTGPHPYPNIASNHVTHSENHFS